MNESAVNETAAHTDRNFLQAHDEEVRLMKQTDPCNQHDQQHALMSMLSVNAQTVHETDRAEQGMSIEALAQALEAFLWPHGPKGQGCMKGRSWASLDIATDEIEQFMQAQGCPSVKVKNQTYFDSAKTRVKKRVFKCPCAGVYKPRAIDQIAVDGAARQTTTKKCDCGVYININVEVQTGECLASSKTTALLQAYI
eukprot:10354-Heterococcus_DN1.PRE.1